MNATPAVKARLAEQAVAFAADLVCLIEELEPSALYRWVADRQYRDACDLANLARIELENAPGVRRSGH